MAILHFLFMRCRSVMHSSNQAPRYCMHSLLLMFGTIYGYGLSLYFLGHLVTSEDNVLGLVIIHF